MNKFLRLLIAALLFIMFVLLLFSARSESPTFDEFTHLNAGYEFLVNHDFRLDPLNPPLAREILALPAIINKNAVLNDLTLLYPRLVVIAFTLGLGLIVYFFSKTFYGNSSAILALFLYILEPNILANGHYAQPDLIFTFFYMLSLLVFYLWQNNFTIKKTIIFGIIVGLLLSTKTTASSFIFIPVIFLYLIKHNFKIATIKPSRKNLLSILIFSVCCLTALWGTYFFKFEPLLGYRFDPNRPAIGMAKHNNLIKFALDTPLPLGSYISSIKQVLVFNYSGLYTKDSMILGQISHTGQPGYYFIPLIMIKTPFPLLILFFLCLFLFRKRMLKDAILLVPILFILLSVSISNLTIVYRYVLPIIPLLIIYVSQIAQVNLKMYNFKKYFWLVILVWYLIESLSSFPHYVSYINLVLGGDRNGYRYVFDANYDWGQGLIALNKFQQKNGNKKLQLAYFGNISPSRYGIKYERLKTTFNTPTDNKPETRLRTDKDTIVAISATCWYLCGHKDNPLLKSKIPSEIVGGSILIFKF